MKHVVAGSLLLAGLLGIGATGCESHQAQNMLVARVDGDVYLPRLSGVPWLAQESVDCELASQFGHAPVIRYQSPAPDDLLLCGERTFKAWEVTWLRPDIKAEIYRLAERRNVDFRDTGHSRGWRGSRRYWNCRWTSGHIDCE